MTTKPALLPPDFRSVVRTEATPKVIEPIETPFVEVEKRKGAYA